MFCPHSFFLRCSRSLPLLFLAFLAFLSFPFPISSSISIHGCGKKRRSREKRRSRDIEEGERRDKWMGRMRELRKRESGLKVLQYHTFTSTLFFFLSYLSSLPLPSGLCPSVCLPLGHNHPPSLRPFSLFLARLQASHPPLALVHTFHFPFICSPCIHPSLLPAPSSTIITFVPVKRQQTPRSFIFLSFYPPTPKILPVSPPQPPPTSLPPIHLRFQLLPFQPLTPFSTLCSVSDKPLYAPLQGRGATNLSAQTSP